MIALVLSGAIALAIVTFLLYLLAIWIRAARELKTDADLKTYRDPAGRPYGRTDRTLWT